MFSLKLQLNGWDGETCGHYSCRPLGAALEHGARDRILADRTFIVCIIGIMPRRWDGYQLLILSFRLRDFPVRNQFKVCGNIGLYGIRLRLIADRKTYRKPQPD